MLIIFCLNTQPVLTLLNVIHQNIHRLQKDNWLGHHASQLGKAILVHVLDELVNNGNLIVNAAAQLVCSINCLIFF